jgi:hypothetical protein
MTEISRIPIKENKTIPAFAGIQILKVDVQ